MMNSQCECGGAVQYSVALRCYACLSCDIWLRAASACVCLPCEAARYGDGDREPCDEIPPSRQQDTLRVDDVRDWIKPGMGLAAKASGDIIVVLDDGGGQADALVYDMAAQFAFRSPLGRRDAWAVVQDPWALATAPRFYEPSPARGEPDLLAIAASRTSGQFHASA